jgi:glutathione synthase/RimK-type ligase-like ATP-grasp enzyme
MNMFKTVTITSNSKIDAKTLLVSQDLIDTIIPNKKEIKLSVGQTSINLQIKPAQHAKSVNLLSVNKIILKKLYLSDGHSYGIACEPQRIRIGPVVGIMADLYGDPNRPFGGQSLFLQQLLTSGRMIGELCFAFSPYGINWDKKQITGYSYSNKGWQKGLYPFPDVVYPRERAYSSAKIAIRVKLERSGVKLLNPSLVGKWQAHKIVSQNPLLQPFLPDTKLVKDFREIDHMINKYKAVYLKPVNGSQGKNIIKVVKNSGGYKYQYQFENQTVKGSASSITRLRGNLRRIMGNRSYIIQNQIYLLKSNGNILDVRILVQKDHMGKWGVTGMACRIGRPGSITSNISRGGSGGKVDTVLRRKFADEQRIKIVETLNFVALEVAKTLEKSLGPLGELGIDIGIDEEGQVWFIEANLRPARLVFTLIGEKETRQLSVDKPMLYSRYLAKFYN